jgi:hypothetical protein
MITPDPLPQPGAWLVMPDGSLYETVANPDDVPGNTGADAAGVYYLSVDSGDVIWTPWSDVEAVGTYDEVDALSAAIAQRDADKWHTGNRPRVTIAHTTRWDVTIWHAPGNPPTDAVRLAVRAIIEATLRAAGITDAAVMIEPEPTE